MADIFLSYARKDTDKAKQLVEHLEQHGLDVWWDPEIDPGTQWADVIEGQLESAKCVIVVWSEDSVGSHWVRTEAHHALSRGVLLPVSIGTVEPPFGFELIQSEDLSDWQSETVPANFDRVVGRARSLITGKRETLPAAQSVAGGFKRPTGGLLLTVLAAVIIVTLLNGSISNRGLSLESLIGMGSVGLLAVNGLAGLMGKSPRRAPPGGRRFRFPLEQGFFGGLCGGIAAAALIGLAYEHGSERDPFALLLQITITAMSIGALLGILSFGLAKWFEYIGFGRPALKWLSSPLLGGTLGGLVAGLITGPPATLYFGSQPDLDVLDPTTMLLAALPATGIMVFAILAFDKHRLGAATLVRLVISAISVAITSIVAFVALYAVRPEIETLVIDRLVYFDDRSDLLTAGLYYGGGVGVFLGLVVGLSVALMDRYAHRRGADETEA